MTVVSRVMPNPLAKMVAKEKALKAEVQLRGYLSIKTTRPSSQMTISKVTEASKENLSIQGLKGRLNKCTQQTTIKGAKVC